MNRNDIGYDRYIIVQVWQSANRTDLVGARLNNLLCDQRSVRSSQLCYRPTRTDAPRYFITLSACNAVDNLNRHLGKCENDQPYTFT